MALLHTEVPSVFEATPESLTDADFYFWREEFPTSRLREAIDERAVPAIGAYLGEVLVRNLGGRWIPRQKLKEAQVLVGNRVWFPFVRARHYMRSRQVAAGLLPHPALPRGRAAPGLRTSGGLGANSPPPATHLSYSPLSAASSTAPTAPCPQAARA